MVLYLLTALILIIIIYMNIEARLVKVEHIKFTKNKKHLKIIQLSDIHIVFLMVSVKRIRQLIQKENPDILLLTGDYISKPKHMTSFLKLLRQIQGKYKIYACIGNHELKAFRGNQHHREDFINQLHSFGVQVLSDQSSVFEKNSKKYCITGFNDYADESHSVEKAIQSISQEANIRIGITHNPELLFEIPSKKIDYLFAGHFHGGQIWAPFNIEFLLMRRERLCKMGIRKGLHKINSIKLYISRGLGNVCFPFRFFSRPEITVFYIP